MTSGALAAEERSGWGDRPNAAPPSAGLRGLVARVAIVALPLVIVVVAVAVLLWPRIFISVPVGHTGVLFRLFTGTETNQVYPAGLHVIAPWNDMVLYETRKQVVNHGFAVLSLRGLTVRLELVIRLRPSIDQLGLLHQRIGPEYIHRLVVPQTESVLRRTIGRRTAEDVYTNADGLLGDAVAVAKQRVDRNFVEVEDIIIRTVELPAMVREAIEDKMTQRELLESYAFRLQTAEQEAERLRDEARGIRDYQREVDSTLTDRLLQHIGIRATRELSSSENASVVLLGSGEDGLPMIPGGR